MKSPKILYFDIESAGVNALRSDLGFVILFGYKWNYEKEARIIVIDRTNLRKFNDKILLQKASRVFTKADLVVAHYGSVFDRRFIQGRLLLNGLPPIPMTKMRDTCMIARSVANFSSNRLKHLTKILHLKHQKLDNGWPTAWLLAMQGDMKAIRGLAKYCKGDVLALEELYNRLLPFDNAHPRIYNDDSCRVCGGQVQHRGIMFVGERKYRRFVCTACGKWDRSRKAL